MFGDVGEMYKMKEQMGIEVGGQMDALEKWLRVAGASE